jgi:hypothetical protein
MSGQDTHSTRRNNSLLPPDMEAEMSAKDGDGLGILDQQNEIHKRRKKMKTSTKTNCRVISPLIGLIDNC